MTTVTLSPRSVTDEQKISVIVNPVSSEDDNRPRTATDEAPHKEENEDGEGNHDGWETDSLYEDIIDEIEDSQGAPRPEDCTVEEAMAYKRRLHEIGPEKFIFETVSSGKVTAKKLCSAFGIRAINVFEGQQDEAYYPLLGVAISRELSKRSRLPQYQTIDDAAKLLRNSKNIMVITGAGISTSLGIPDFRSKDTGFYSKLESLGFSEPQEVFDLQNFDDDPSTFYSLAGDILPDLKRWSPTHEFIRLLEKKGKLLTNYTQNIDNIESHAGISPEKVLQCHGSWATATCRKCGYQVPGTDIFDSVRSQQVAKCERCIVQLKALRPRSLKRKRSSNSGMSTRRTRVGSDSDSDGYEAPEPGVMKPDITFFGEQLPEKFFDRFRGHDRDLVDLVIVIGTSMKVAPVAEVPHAVPRDVPQIYISRDPIRHLNFDINLIGNCDTVVAELCRRTGWKLQHEMLPKDLQVSVEPVEGEECHYKVVELDAKPRVD